MEDSSNNGCKRGRPRIRPNPRQFTNLSQARTGRGTIEWLLMCHAWAAIKESWERDPKSNAWAAYYLDSTKGHIFHKSILAALARLEDSAAILEWARVIAEKKIPTKIAVASIRRARLGREPEQNYLTLFARVEAVVNDYLAARPSTPRDTIIQALLDVAACLED